MKSQISKYNNITFSKNEVVGNIILDLKDEYGALTSNQLKTITSYIKKMPEIMTPEEALKAKRMYDGLIANTSWSKIVANADPQLSFATQVKYILRDNLRKAINEKTGNAAIQQINNRMSIAMEMRDLTATQMARRAKEKTISGSNPFGKIIGKIFDDIILNPAITTRTSQTLKSLGSKTGQTPLRSVGRSVLIKQVSK